MEPCICAYIPQQETSSEETIIPKSTDYEEESKESETDISLQSNLNEYTSFENTSTNLENQENGSTNKFFEPHATDDSTSASQVLAVKAQNWQLKRELSEAQDSIRCLEQSLREQWSDNNKLIFEIQHMKEEKSKLIIELQKEFSAHINERNKLVLEITVARQNNMLTIQEIGAAETKNKQLKIERNETAECLYKATVDLYRHHTLEEIEHQNSLSNLISDKENSIPSTTSQNSSSTESIESIVGTNTTECSTLESSSTEYAPETSIEMSDIEIKSFKDESKNKQQTFPEQIKTSNEIRLDFSFVDREKLQHADSGFSEATNLATQSSATTIRIIEATTPNILE